MTQFSIPNADPVVTLTFDEVVAIDISSFTGAGDYISFSLPEFPRTKVELAKTFVDFTSNSSGNFGVGPVDQIAFSEASPALPGGAGDTEMRIPIALLKNINKSELTGVRFRIFAKEVCSFRCLSIRACSESWKYAPIDLDTLWHRVHRPPPPSGKVAPTITFPEAASAPKTWPILFRSNAMSGLSDPMPVNLSIGASFTAGSFAQATSSGSNFNEFALYFRDVPTDNQTMIEMNAQKQNQLEAHAGQPDFGRALYDARDQDDIDIYHQSELDERTMFNIERKPDESEHTWLEVKLRWGAIQASNKLTIFNADGVGYEFTNMAIEASNKSELDAGRYIMIIELKDSWIRVQIFHLNQVGEFASEASIFDTGRIIDDTLIKRRKGRFGWWTSLFDGDAHIDNVKTRDTNFGEVISKEFQSITPVKGISLYAGSTSEHKLVSGVETTDPENVKLSLDPGASATGGSIKVQVAPLKPLQGIATNTFLIDNPDNVHISFDIKFPSSEIPGGGLSAFLLGAYEDVIPVNLSSFNKDIWTHVKVSLKNVLFQTGRYKLILMQTLPVVATSWWIENLSVKTYSVKWSARPHKSDAWNTEGGRWQEVGFTLNSLNGGVVFKEHGKGLQVRGQALRQDAMISDFKAIPQYASLGRMVYRDEFPVQTTFSPSLTVEGTITERKVKFFAEAVGSIVAYYWDFGDGTQDVGQVVSHTYKAPGKYVTTVTVSNAEGQKASAQKTVTIS